MTAAPTAGYSGTPLPKKLGIKERHRVALLSPPPRFEETLGALPMGASAGRWRRGAGFDIALLFVREGAELAERLPRVKEAMADTSGLWVCWPKKTSALASSLDGNEVRAIGLAAGLVDVKVCAVDEDWSGLKFVYRLAERGRLVKKK